MLMDGCTFDEYFLLTDELQGLMEGEGIDWKGKEFMNLKLFQV